MDHLVDLEEVIADFQENLVPEDLLETLVLWENKAKEDSQAFLACQVHLVPLVEKVTGDTQATQVHLAKAMKDQWDLLVCLDPLDLKE